MSYTNYSIKAVPFPIRYVVELFRYRHLAVNLVGSDLRARFRRSYLGILWAVLQPLGFSLIVALVWSQVFKADSLMSFTVYVYTGMIVWEYFSGSILLSMDSLTNSSGYLKQARIPFLIFQLRVPLTGLVIMFFGLVGLVGLMAMTGQVPTLGPSILLIPVFFSMLLLFCIPLSVLGSLIGPTFRDARYIIGLFMQAVFFISPVILDRAVLQSESLLFLEFANPVIVLLDLFRDPMLYGMLWERSDVVTWAVWTCGLWIIAFWAAIESGRKIVFAL